MRPSLFLVAALAAVLLAPGAAAACSKGCDKCKGNKCTKCQEARWVESPEGDMVRQLAYGQTKRGTCKRCLFEFGDYCVACSGDTPWKCTKCNDVFGDDAVYLTTKGRCRKCPMSCAACKNGSGKCTQCISGDKPVKGVC